jgi:ParB family transcriptional regulator, chromosome partitioning protein
VIKEFYVAQQKRGLGRGLGALIPAGQGSPPSARTIGTLPSHDHDGAGGAAAGAYFEEVLIGAVTPNPRQPRQNFDEDTLAELVSSVREVGLLQPIVVRKVMPGHYELVMGERRWRAAQQAGLDRVPAIVRDTADTDMLRDALIENLHREQLNPLDEAAAYQQLLDDFGATHEELAARVGRSRPHISNTIRLLNLPPAVQKRVAAGVLSAGHARALLALDDTAEQERLAQRIVAEGLSVRAVEEIVAVGDGSSAKPERRQAAKPVMPGLRELSDRLSDFFETRVKVELGRRKGKIVVEFASLDDLERIVTAMSPTAAVRGGRSPQRSEPPDPAGSVLAPEAGASNGR